MAKVTFDSSEVDALIERLKNSPASVNAELAGGMAQATEIVRKVEAWYPEYAGEGRLHLGGENPKPFYSEKQRRYFFWAKREGLIDPGSGERSGALAESWQTSVESGEGQFQGTVWTESPVAKWVMDARFQAGMFRGYWAQAQERFRDPGVRQDIRRVLANSGRRAIKLLFFGG